MGWIGMWSNVSVHVDMTAHFSSLTICLWFFWRFSSALGPTIHRYTAIQLQDYNVHR